MDSLLDPPRERKVHSPYSIAFPKCSYRNILFALHQIRALLSPRRWLYVSN